MSVWTHEYVFGALGPNSILCCCSTCFSFGYWEFFQLACVSLWHIPLIVGFFSAFSYFLPLQDAGSSYTFSFLSSRFSHCSKEPCFPLWENYIKNQDVGTRYVHCYWMSLFLGLLGWQSKEKYVYILTCEYMHIYKYVYTLLSVYMAREKDF